MAQAGLPLGHGVCKLAVVPGTERLVIVEIVPFEAARIAHEMVGEVINIPPRLNPVLELAVEIGVDYIVIFPRNFGVSLLVSEDVEDVGGDFGRDREGWIDGVPLCFPG